MNHMTPEQERAAFGQEHTPAGQGRTTAEQERITAGQERITAGQDHATVEQGRTTVGQQERAIAGQKRAASSPACGVVDPAGRRFASVSRVYGSEGRERLWQSHAVVIGIGGVGSWAAEALARSGVGTLTLIDLDHVAESNINRQVHALTSTLGAAKVEAMAARIRDISPDITLHLVDDFVEPGTEGTLIPAGAGIIIDAIDAVAAKASLIAWCVTHEKPVIVCGAAGGRTDPLQLRADDLARTTGDALLSAVRARLRQRYGFVRADGTVKLTAPDAHRVAAGEVRATTAPGTPGAVGGAGGAGVAGGVAGGVASADLAGSAPAVSVAAPAPLVSSRSHRKKRVSGGPPRFGVTAIYSPEQVAGTRPQGEGGGMPLACAGYGSLVTVTASMGLAAASQAIAQLLR